MPHEHYYSYIGKPNAGVAALQPEPEIKSPEVSKAVKTISQHVADLEKIVENFGSLLATIDVNFVKLNLNDKTKCKVVADGGSGEDVTKEFIDIVNIYRKNYERLKQK